MMKRLFDVGFAFFGMALLAPMTVLVWVLIHMDDGGPVFYRQLRVGQDGRPFKILKFRTMSVGAESAGPAITASGDRRVTRVGAVLRSSKLDELPQLWNVLRGEMSIVGPRPEVPRYVALYTPEQRVVLRLRPGITDEASVQFKDEERLLARAPDPEEFYLEHCVPRKIELNLAYGRRANVLRDLVVIWRTIAAVWLSRLRKR
jgi:lipopolysaccharide/colanic/teichoic acid biosynthesis glycosyltransferase